jgi:hypothetical protein
MAGALLGQIADPIAFFTADGTYDQDQVNQAVAECHPDAAVIVPPRAGAGASASAGTAATQRDRHLRMIAERGRMAWQKASGYNLRPRPFKPRLCATQSRTQLPCGNPLPSASRRAGAGRRYQTITWGRPIQGKPAHARHLAAATIACQTTCH